MIDNGNREALGPSDERTGKSHLVIFPSAVEDKNRFAANKRKSFFDDGMDCPGGLGSPAAEASLPHGGGKRAPGIVVQGQVQVRGIHDRALGLQLRIGGKRFEDQRIDRPAPPRRRRAAGPPAGRIGPRGFPFRAPVRRRCT